MEENKLTISGECVFDGLSLFGALRRTHQTPDGYGLAMSIQIRNTRRVDHL